jgi:hypothetical protein
MVLGSGISAELTEMSKWALLSSVIELGYSVLISQMMPMPQGSEEANGVQGELRSLHCMCTTYMYDICMLLMSGVLGHGFTRRMWGVCIQKKDST